MPVPYLSANRPVVAEAAGVEPARPCGTRGFRDRPPRQWGLRFHVGTAFVGAARTIDDLWTAIAQALPQLTPKDCASYFTAAGYGAV